jgi:hypothetical protein
MHTQGKLAIDEFSFRYLYPEDARSAVRPLDELEQRIQLHAPSYPGCQILDIEPQFRACALGEQIAESLLHRVVSLLMFCHVPARTTPNNSYATHTSYPSPRSYYVLQFVIEENTERYCVDFQTMALKSMEALPTSLPKNQVRLRIKADFSRYDAIYNLFRKALFALEAGHFFSELFDLGQQCGLRLQAQIDQDGIAVMISADTSTETDPSILLQHTLYASTRNSGQINNGMFFTAFYRFHRQQFFDIVSTLHSAMKQAAEIFPILRNYPLSAALCVRAGENLQAGIYSVETEDRLHQLTAFDPVDLCQENFTYNTFSFASVPAVLYLCVDQRAFSFSDQEFLELNCALGYVMQNLIRLLVSDGLFGRPFRSYNQFGVDQMLGNSEKRRKAYYGLIVGKNRAQCATGILR